MRTKRGSGPDHTEKLETWVKQLEQRATEYYPDLYATGLRVEPTNFEQRRQSSLQFFELSDGRSTHEVVVKFSEGAASGGMPADRDRPRLGLPLAELGQAIIHQRQAIQLTYQHFHGLGDPRLGALRLLDVGEDGRSFALEVVHDPTLKELIGHHRLGRNKREHLLAACFNTGVWLREFHSIAPPSHARDVRSDRSEFLQALSDFCAYLAEVRGPRAFFVTVEEALRRAASAVLPTRLPLGLAHGDSAPRNIFVNANGRVTALDMLAAWRAPVYEDLAYFIVDLATSRSQAFSFGVAQSATFLSELKDAVFAGYFAQAPIPSQIIDLFSVLVALDRWASVEHRHAGGNAFATSLGAQLQALHYRRTVRRLVARLAMGSA